MAKPWQNCCPDLKREFNPNSKVDFLPLTDYIKLAMSVLRNMGFYDATYDEDAISHLAYCGMIAEITWNSTRNMPKSSWRYFKMKKGALEILRYGRAKNRITRKAREKLQTIRIGQKLEM